ncbi:baseplate J/gp47 family protein [Ancylobacter defluvii]|uniref:Tail protein n=1 Tax=Ancylobacter defluvii TaxID=1282440 RepID=A0A9W6NCD3_9HYPH|nr:baseplate J/gp47 family protein [Ancylobacter defluvii]MBS7586397.1 baseplate J/gp47 family protein [Ancylobacter defluvii]GLK85678.1 tail protein [Ancylobacter defluvii]
MPFPISDPTTLTRRLETLVETEIRKVRPDVNPAELARAVRSPRGMFGIIIRTFVLGLYEVHLHLKWWGQQYFPDTAEAEYLVRHASIWGIARRPATFAIGKAGVVGVPDTVVPAGRLLQGTGVTYEVTEAETIAIDGTASLTVRATSAGTIGNAAAGLQLSLLETIPGLTEQLATIDDAGVTGGAEIERDPSLLSRLLERIREPAHGGASFDYPRWVQNQFAASHVKTLPNWVGRGSVGVAIAMGTKANPRAPTETELEAIGTYLDEVRPVTAECAVIPAVIVPRNITLVLDPSTFAVQEAVKTAARTFFAAEAEIGGRLRFSRLSEAVSSAAGEYAHRFISPTADIVSAATELSVPGTITFEADE